MNKQNLVYDEKVKILMLGESGVGKTSLLQRFTEDKFSPKSLTTLGVEFKQKLLVINERKVLVQIWDTAGQERFRTITPMYYKSVDGVVLVYDITNDESFESIEYWMKNIREQGDRNVLSILVGNKIDMAEQRVIEGKKGQDFIAENGCIQFYEASAKSNQNVQNTFQDLTQQILLKRALGQGIQKNDHNQEVQLSAAVIPDRKKKCC